MFDNTERWTAPNIIRAAAGLSNSPQQLENFPLQRLTITSFLSVPTLWLIR